MANSVGIIDSGYRGNIQGMFDYVGDRIYVDKAVEQYDRIVQLCSPTLGPVYVELVPSNILERTERGVGGIGSTGF
jgi:dUTP pyrophosphatase